MNSDSPQTPRILITRLSAIGDCVHTVPMVAALRTKFPSAYIAWATQNAGAQLLQDLEGLDDILVIDRNWLKRPKSILATRSLLRSGRFDIAIDPQSLTKSSLLAWLSGAKTRIGFALGQGRELGPWLSTIRIQPEREHVVDRYLELLKPLGISNPDVHFLLPQRSSAKENIQAFLTREAVQNRFALLNPGAGWNSKLWPHERYASVADFLHRKFSLNSIVLWAGDRERNWAKAICESAPTSTVMAPDTSLQELTEICRLAELFVGSDTGPLHLAAAVGTPTVAMYGPTKTSVCGPYAGKTSTGGEICLHEPLQVRYQGGTSKERRGNDNSAMCEISIDHVVAACERILSRRATSKVA